MFELLLQADKALAAGSLDQAEKTYWQIIELDPANAIAVAGLARVSIERGDERRARTFADRALGIDPESIAARWVLQTLENKATGTAEPDVMAGPLRAAEQLEALSRRRGADSAGTEEITKSSASRRGAAKAKGQALATPPAAPTRGSRGRTRPDQIGPLPSEPLRERRQAGRLAAAAAAAAAAAREPVQPRHEPHHAMPMGRRLFEPGQLKSPPSDAFSDAEMAAVVEAVDALDDTAPTATIAPETGVEAGGLADVMRAIDATEADETVAIRIALVSGAAVVEAAELEAAEFAGHADRDVFDAGQSDVAAALDVEDAAGPLPPPEVEPGADAFAADPEAAAAIAAGVEAAEAAEAFAAATARAESLPRPEFEPEADFGVEPGADEFEAAEAQARSQARRELGPRQDETTGPDSGEFEAAPAPAAFGPGPAQPAEAADAAEAEAAAAAEAVREVARASEDEQLVPAAHSRRPHQHSGAEEPSEQEAEAQALREAMAIVLGADGEAEAGAAEAPGASTGAAGSPTGPADAAGPDDDTVIERPDGEPVDKADSEAPTIDDTRGDSPRRKRGLFRRFRSG
jgi:tetratricopeptide (TPR) repeat protein